MKSLKSRQLYEIEGILDDYQSVITISKCNGCNYFENYGLPCMHLLKIAELGKCKNIDESLFHRRWHNTPCTSLLQLNDEYINFINSSHSNSMELHLISTSTNINDDNIQYRYNKLLSVAKVAIQKCIGNSIQETFLMDRLNEVISLVDSSQSTINNLDPLTPAKTKGRPSMKRLGSDVNKAKTKKAKVVSTITFDSPTKPISTDSNERNNITDAIDLTHENDYYYSLKLTKPTQTRKKNNHNNINFEEKLLNQFIEETVLLKEEILLNEKNYDKSYVVTTKFNFMFYKSSLMRLADGVWLDDESINFYLKMLQELDIYKSTMVVSHVTSLFFQSTFLTLLLERCKMYSFKEVRRFTDKTDPFERNKIIIPVNSMNLHWFLVVIFVDTKRVILYDSLPKQLFPSSLETAINRWLQDEWNRTIKTKDESRNYLPRSKKGIFPTWTFDVAPVNAQNDGHSCGLHVIGHAERAWLYGEGNLDYVSESNMKSWRPKISLAIKHGSLIPSK
jgi:Ulp1 family protease